MKYNTFLKEKNIKFYSVTNLETDVKGYWKSEKGQVFIDNIIIQSCNTLNLQYLKKKAFESGELAIFYTHKDNTSAYIETLEGIEILKKLYKYTIINNYNNDTLAENIINELFEKHNGFTVFYNRIDNTFTIEAWEK